jgi:hypothetical protein
MWNKEVVALPSGISDILRLLIEMPEIPEEMICIRALTKYESEFVQICLQIYALKAVETNSIYDSMQVRRGSNYEPEEVH